ncbi:hypothetical protein G6F59_017146 [Rhizopus arrhizus]|nr:hypothetical protein G6F59_017146 [Rhizopus arrhizus]
MNEIRAVTIFARAAVLGSLRRAAVDQGISPQAASHAVMQLEKELGVRLFHRTTRKLSLTEEGQQLLESRAQDDGAPRDLARPDGVRRGTSQRAAGRAVR